jgi:RimJ/RimL family protein N-acetyltransferase
MTDWMGKKSRLRAVETDDLEIFYEWNQDTDAQRAMDYVWFPSSRAGLAQWIQHETTKGPKGDQFSFVIENMAGEFVGIISSHTCDLRVGSFRYGVAIRAPFQRQGYASEAIVLLTRFMFMERRYQKVTAEVYSYNAASQKLHERLGFQLEGRIRRTLYTNGRFHDQIFYGMTREEFEAIHGG